MPAKEPDWWYLDELTWQPRVLAPAAKLYGAIAARRMSSDNPYRSRFPVICVGNFTAGGTGKTPTCLLLADLIESLGAKPWFLSRGYGGRLDGQERVDPARHGAAEVGDEPLLLAARAPTVISRDRRLGAEFIERSAPDGTVIIMDDGLQNPALAKDLTIAVIDGSRGLGNGQIIPAGPLRAPMSSQMSRTDLILINGTGDRARQHLDQVPDRERKPELSATPQPVGDQGWLKGAAVVAYAGIANPERFFSLLEKLGATVVERVVFADHQSISQSQAGALIRMAADGSAQLVTTQKDFVRLSGLDGTRENLRAVSQVLPIELNLPGHDREILLAHLRKVLPRPASS